MKLKEWFLGRKSNLHLATLKISCWSRNLLSWLTWIFTQVQKDLSWFFNPFCLECSTAVLFYFAVSSFIFNSPYLIVVSAAPSWSLSRPHCHPGSSGYRFQHAQCLMIWPPLYAWPCSLLGCEQRIFHNNRKTSKLIPTNPYKEPREPKLFQMRCFCQKSTGRATLATRGRLAHFISLWTQTRV